MAPGQHSSIDSDINDMLVALDRLLDHPAAATQLPPPPHVGKQLPPVAPLPASSDLDDLLRELDAEIQDDDPVKLPPRSSPLSSSAAKCLVATLANGPAACQYLRCTMCDHDVVQIRDQVWDPACDYFFFRNNVPNLAKLSAKLIPRPGTAAYACQCNWTTVSKAIRVGSGSTLRWVCAGHDDHQQGRQAGRAAPMIGDRPAPV